MDEDYSKVWPTAQKRSSVQESERENRNTQNTSNTTYEVKRNIKNKPARSHKRSYRRLAGVLVAATILAGGIGLVNELGEKTSREKPITIEQLQEAANKKGIEELIMDCNEIQPMLTELEYQKSPQLNYSNAWKEELEQVKKLIAEQQGIPVEEYSKIEVHKKDMENVSGDLYYATYNNEKIDLDKDTKKIVEKLIDDQYSGKENEYSQEVYEETYNNTTKVMQERIEQAGDYERDD